MDTKQADLAEIKRIEREMRDYVEAMAEYSTEFTDETVEHTVERLLRETEWC